MTTRKEDAASIVGDELADELDKKAKLVGKSEVLVERSEDESEKDEVKEEIVTESVVEKQMMGDEDEMTMRPFGGAMSLEDAQKWMDDQKESMLIADSWYMLSAIVGNIMQQEGCSTKDKKGMMKKAMDQFKSRIENKALTVLSEFDTKAFVTKSTLQEIDHPLNDAISSLKKSFDGIVTLAGTEEDKLRSLQEPFEAFANVLKAKVSESVLPVTTESTPDFAKMLSEAINPLAEQVKSLNAQLAAMKGVNVQTNIPERRSIQPSQNTTTNPNVEKNDLHSIIRRSVGLPY